jgi:hypothetical protein
LNEVPVMNRLSHKTLQSFEGRMVHNPSNLAAYKM